MQKPIEKWEELKEALANIEHQRWADWQKWCHKILRENCPSSELEKVLEKVLEKLEKWDKQIKTSYKDLTEKEKNGDREQVDRYLLLLKEFFETLLQTTRKEAIERKFCPKCGDIYTCSCFNPSSPKYNP